MPTPLHSTDWHNLSIDDRLLIVEQIWDSIAAEQDQLPLAAEQRAELDRRLNDIDECSKSSCWEEVKARLLNKG